MNDFVWLFGSLALCLVKFSKKINSPNMMYVRQLLDFSKNMRLYSLNSAFSDSCAVNFYEKS